MTKIYRFYPAIVTKHPSLGRRKAGDKSASETISSFGGHMKRDNSSPKKLTKCICPRCRRNHKMLINWIGTIPARKYCRECNIIAERSSRYITDTVSLSNGKIDIEYRISKKEGIL